jgi:hypothetical protein
MAANTSRWLDVSDDEGARRDDLIDQLREAGVRYVGSGRTPTGAVQRWPIHELVPALARSADPRLRLALVALLLRNPDRASPALSVADTDDDPAVARFIRISVLAAAALQRTWAFSLDLYLPGWTAIDAARLARELGVPQPEEDYGRDTLRALDRLLAGDDPVAPDYWGAWEDVGRHVMDDLRAEAAGHAA